MVPPIPPFLILWLFVHMGYYLPTSPDLDLPDIRSVHTGHCPHSMRFPPHTIGPPPGHGTLKINITSQIYNIPKQTEIKYFYIVLFKFLKDRINILLNFKMSSMSNLRHR